MEKFMYVMDMKTFGCGSLSVTSLNPNSGAVLEYVKCKIYMYM